MTHFRTFISIFLTLFVGVIHANSTVPLNKRENQKATVKNNQVQSKAKEDKSKYSIGPEFDDSIAALPPNFSGNSFWAIYRSLLVSPRSEFETAAEYEARKQAAVKPSTYAIVLPQPYAPYLVDEEKFNIKFYRDSYIYQGFTYAKYGGVVVKRESSVTGKYRGTNSFGVYATVRQSTIRTWALLPNEKNFSCINMSFHAARDQARLIKEQISLLAVVNIDADSLPKVMESSYDFEQATGYNSTEATIDRPDENTYYYYSVPAKVKELWLFNFATGEIFGKYAFASDACK